MPGAFKQFMFGPSLNHSVPPCPKRRRQSQGGGGPNSSDSGGKKAAIWERGKKVDIIQNNGWHVSFPDPSLALCDVSVFHFLRWRGSGAEKRQLAMNCGSTVQAFGVCVCVHAVERFIKRSGDIHYITLHYITLHYITLHYITLHTLHQVTLCYLALPCIALRYIALHYIILHYITLDYIHTSIYIYIYIHNYPQTPCVAQTLTLRMLCCRIW